MIMIFIITLTSFIINMFLIRHINKVLPRNKVEGNELFFMIFGSLIPIVSQGLTLAIIIYLNVVVKSEKSVKNKRFRKFFNLD